MILCSLGTWFSTMLLQISSWSFFCTCAHTFSLWRVWDPAQMLTATQRLENLQGRYLIWNVWIGGDMVNKVPHFCKSIIARVLFYAMC